MAIIRGINGNVFLANGTAASFTDEAMTANVAKTVYTIDAAAKRFWSPTDAVTVKYDGGAVTSYASIQYPGGVVTWAETPGNAAVVCSGKYYPVAALGTVRGWTLEAAPTFEDVTCLQDAVRIQAPVLLECSATIEKFYVDETVYEDISASTALVGFDLFWNYDAGTPANCLRFTGYGYISSHGINLSTTSMVNEPLSLTVNVGPYLMSGLA